MTLSRIAPIAGLVLALTAVWVWTLQPNNTGETSAALSDPDQVAAFEQQITRLRTELADARTERRALFEELEGLRAELETLALPEGMGEGDDFAVSATDPSDPSESTQENQPQPQGTGVFDETSLLLLGFSQSEVSRLRESFEASQLEELYLRDRATREGWVQKPRFMLEMGQVKNRFRDSMSDDEFDRMLYASGKENRVVLAHVLHDSPAQNAGLEDGDVVISYNDLRIFKPGELKRATTTSPPGQTPIIVERNGAPLRLFLPAGPLGAQLERKASPPYP